MILLLSLPQARVWGIDVYCYNASSAVPVASLTGVQKLIPDAQTLTAVLYDGSQSTVSMENVDNLRFYDTTLTKLDETSGPAKGQVSCVCRGDMLYVTANSDISKIEMYSNGGQKAMTLSCSGTQKGVSISALQDGVYIVKVTTAEDVYINKIIKH